MKVMRSLVGLPSSEVSEASTRIVPPRPRRKGADAKRGRAARVRRRAPFADGVGPGYLPNLRLYSMEEMNALTISAWM